MSDVGFGRKVPLHEAAQVESRIREAIYRRMNAEETMSETLRRAICTEVVEGFNDSQGRYDTQAVVHSAPGCECGRCGFIELVVRYRVFH